MGPKLSARAVDVQVADATAELRVALEDGRSITVPLAWFPRLASATEQQRDNWKLIGRGIGIHWPDVDEDISVENLLGADGELLTAHAPVPDVESDPWRGQRAAAVQDRKRRLGKTAPSAPEP